jgi:DNA-directed RNA polymerase specialized sigma24 family protein
MVTRCHTSGVADVLRGVGATSAANDDHATVEASRQADEALFVASYATLRRFASSVAPSHADPDDLVQEAVARTLRGGPLSRLDDPLQYLRRVVLNLVVDLQRARGRETRTVHLLTADDAALPVYPSDVSMLDTLDPVDRALLHLVDLEGVSIADASRVVGRNAAAARARVMRARRKLRAQLAKEDS